MVKRRSKASSTRSASPPPQRIWYSREGGAEEPRKARCRAGPQRGRGAELSGTGAIGAGCPGRRGGPEHGAVQGQSFCVLPLRQHRPLSFKYKLSERFLFKLV